MKGLKPVVGLLVALTLLVAFAPCASADQEGKSITITIDRKTMPQSIFQLGRFYTVSEKVTLTDYEIRDYAGAPIDGLIIQTCSGQTKIPICTVKEIRLSRWFHRRTDDIFLVEDVVEADITLTDGTMRSVLMNANFGTIAGQSDLGSFFLGDPLTVRHLVFN